MRALLDAAWAGKEDEFSDTDWGSALGGTHVLLEVGGAIISHASVVERILESGEHPMRTGYVEAVATWPEQQGNGYATEVMGAVARILDERYELGGARHGPDQLLRATRGWGGMAGRTTVRTGRGMIGTPEEDGLVMVRRRRRPVGSRTSTRRSVATGARATSGNHRSSLEGPSHPAGCYAARL